ACGAGAARVRRGCGAGAARVRRGIIPFISTADHPRGQCRAMNLLRKHLRNTFLAGIFAAIPLAVTIFIVWYVEHATRETMRQLLDVNVPFLGIAVAIGLIYVLGLIVSSLIGRIFLRLIDWILLRVPGL